ncbi:MAG: hypothetical protein ACREQW_10620 [Candidatus Binatia bacterium]
MLDLVAVPYAAYPQIGKGYTREFTGKIVIDAGNAVLARDGEITRKRARRELASHRRSIWRGHALSARSTR